MKILLLAIYIATLLQPAHAAQSQPGSDPRLAIAEHRLDQFEQQLKTQLMSGLKQSPKHAVEVCREQAPQIAEQLAGPGVTLGRVSHRLRNPQNRPQPWLVPLLEEYRSTAQPQPARALPLADGRLAYVRPIYTKAPCLLCHGENIAEPLQQLVHQLYPHDQAYGFKLGELRGLMWAIID